MAANSQFKNVLHTSKIQDAIKYTYKKHRDIRISIITDSITFDLL